MVWFKDAMRGSKPKVLSKQTGVRLCNEGRWYLKRFGNTLYREHEVWSSKS